MTALSSYKRRVLMSPLVPVPFPVILKCAFITTESDENDLQVFGMQFQSGSCKKAC